MKLRAAIFLVAATGAVAFAAPQQDGGTPTGEQRFHEATSLIGHDDARAAQLLEALAAEHPADDFADDALLEAAELAEERLGRPDHADQLYARLLERYPSSRLSIRAGARHQYLSANLRTGAAPLAEYQDILQHYSSRTPDESTARMEKLVTAHPDFALATEARLWLARAEIKAGRFERAIERYQELERSAPPGSPLAREARKGRADSALAAGRLLDARRTYGSLLDEPGPIADAARAGIAHVDEQLRRLALFYFALAYLLIFLGICAWSARGGLLRMPLELKYYLPVAGLFALAGATEHGAIAAATGAIAAGGALVVWLGGAATEKRLSRAPLSIAARAARAAATALAILALSYAAIHATHLTDFVLETVRHGPER